MEILFRIKNSHTSNRLGWVSLFLSLFLFTSFDANAQEGQAGKIYPTAGITWRSTAMNFFNFKAVLPDTFISRKYEYERNVQGFSLNLGLQYQLSRSVFIEYVPNLRYDVIHFRNDIKDDVLVLVENEVDSFFVNDNPIYIKDFIIDHNFNVMRIKGKMAYGFGFTIVNSGESYQYPANHRIPKVNIRTQVIEFKTYNAFVTFPLKKILNLELKAMYIPKDFPYNKFEKYIMYSMRVYYRFKSLN